MKTLRSVLLAGSLFMFACGLITPDPTATPVPSPTASPVPSRTPAPTRVPGDGFGDANVGLPVALQGFTIQIPYPLYYEDDGEFIVIDEQENLHTFWFTGEKYYLDKPFEEVIDAYLEALEERGWRFTKGATREIEIDRARGMAIEVSAIVEAVELEGRVLVASPGPGFILFGLGLSKVVDGRKMWQFKGRSLFEGLIDTITFTDPLAECPVATDETFGYSSENPIQVGGEGFSGPARERIYLEHLRDAEGERLTYERLGSTTVGEVILDEYQVTGDGLDEVLYLDMYVYSDPQAPAGFTCVSAFPLEAP